MSTLTSLRATYPRIARQIRRPAGFFGRIGDHILFYGKAIAGMPHAAVHYRREVIRLIAEISMGAGTLAMIGGTVAIVGFLTLAAGGTQSPLFAGIGGLERGYGPSSPSEVSSEGSSPRLSGPASMCTAMSME